jgi:hypothetical protein
VSDRKKELGGSEGAEGLGGGLMRRPTTDRLLLGVSAVLLSVIVPIACRRPVTQRVEETEERCSLVQRCLRHSPTFAGFMKRPGSFFVVSNEEHPAGIEVCLYEDMDTHCSLHSILRVDANTCRVWRKDVDADGELVDVLEDDGQAGRQRQGVGVSTVVLFVPLRSRSL